ncbi:MAG: hypothetical protein ACXAC7_00220 [Candidatus Hodarchaeales archaeon]|jgi:hypothetical protein
MAYRSKKKKEKEEEKTKSLDNQAVPDDLEKFPEPLPDDSLNKINQESKSKPPVPITLSKNENGKIKRPTRLPPRFRQQMVKTKQEKIIIPDEKKSQKLPIKPPVTRRRRRETILKESTNAIETTEIKSKTKIKNNNSAIKQTREIHQQIQSEEIEQINEVQKTPESFEQAQSLSSVLQSELLQKNALDINLPQLDVSPILNRPNEQGWPWIKSKNVKIPTELQTFWKAESSLYSSLALLELFTNANERGEIAPEVYHKQLKAVLMEAIQLRFKLEKDDRFDWLHFIKTNKIENFFPNAFEKMCRIEGSSDIDDALEDETHKMDYQEITKLPTKTADYVSNSIELMDLIRLQSIATIERLIPLLEDMRKILQQTTGLVGKDYFVILEINAWLQRLYQEKAGTILPEKELDRLEMQVVRWLNDFRRELKNI